MGNESQADHILRGLECVARERRLRDESPRLAARVLALKRYQQDRLRLTYADLLQSSRYGPASRFFLDELYGPADFTARDDQFARVVPRMVHMLPAAVLDAVCRLAELHALSEDLDSQMGRSLKEEFVDPFIYLAAWQSVGRAADRYRQIDLVIEIGQSLDEFAHLPLLALSLRMMRGPARIAGLGDIQRFLETGLEAFKAMSGAGEFLAQLQGRERSLVRTLFSHGVVGSSTPEVLAELRRELELP